MATQRYLLLLLFLPILTVKKLQALEIDKAEMIAIELLANIKKNPPITTQPPWKCRVCGNDCAHKSRLKAHLYIHYPKSKPFVCTARFCNLRFADKTHLNSHLQRHNSQK